MQAICCHNLFNLPTLPEFEALHLPVAKFYTPPRTGGRVVEGARLESA